MQARIASARSILENAVRPLFLFDDDADGLCSFLILYKLVNSGRGMAVKARPTVEPMFLRKVTEYDPDLVVVLDKSGISEEFIDRCNVPILWVDHHEPQDYIPKEKITFVNPLEHGLEPYPTCYWAYQIAGAPDESLWLVATGCVGDWQIIPDVHERCIESFPSFCPEGKGGAPDYLFDAPIGTLVKIFMLNLKGKSSDVYKSIKTLTRIKGPDEILQQQTPAGRFIYSRYSKLIGEYNQLLERVSDAATGDRLLLFIYNDVSTSMTSFLSNEVLYRFPRKVTLIARKSNGEYKCSLRCSPPMSLKDIMASIIPSVDGYGGGHDQAVGACIQEHDFEKFVELLREEIKNDE
ncbi:MAG: DHH family phosphoesterase [Nanoarchaeota archaeon]